MEFLALVFLWPLLVLTVGVVIVSGFDAGGVGLAMIAVLIFCVFLVGLRDHLGNPKGATPEEEADGVRRSIVAFSIGLLVPIWMSYLLAAMQDGIAGIIVGLLIGFGVLTWGMLLRGNKVITGANILGGGLAIVYLYMQLWQLGQLAQVIGAAFGLLMAVIISVIKFREKLA